MQSCIVAIKILIIAALKLSGQLSEFVWRMCFDICPSVCVRVRPGAPSKWQNLTQENGACLPCKNSLKHTTNTNKDPERRGGQTAEGKERIKKQERVRERKVGMKWAWLKLLINLRQAQTHTLKLWRTEWLLLRIRACMGKFVVKMICSCASTPCDVVVLWHRNCYLWICWFPDKASGQIHKAERRHNWSNTNSYWKAQKGTVINGCMWWSASQDLGLCESIIHTDRLARLPPEGRPLDRKRLPVLYHRSAACHKHKEAAFTCTVKYECKGKRV